MSTHPNAILMVTLKPDGLSRKTMREILADMKVEPDDDVKIGGIDYHHIIMESDYYESLQIAADEGDLVFLKTITYGYGEVIAWGKLEKQKQDLEQWAKEICKRHHCSYKIFITANYW